MMRPSAQALGLDCCAVYGLWLVASGYIISLIPRPGVQSSPIVYTHTTHPGDAALWDKTQEFQKMPFEPSIIPWIDYMRFDSYKWCSMVVLGPQLLADQVLPKSTLIKFQPQKDRSWFYYCFSLEFAQKVAEKLRRTSSSMRSAWDYQLVSPKTPNIGFNPEYVRILGI